MRIRSERIQLVLVATAGFWMKGMAAAERRFPRPEFDTDYAVPTPSAPAPDSNWLQTVDAVVLVAALALTAWLVLRKRSRRWTFAVMIACLIYFGFVRKGCVCAIGAVQNVGLGLFDTAYTVPLTVLIFFLAPLIMALFFGRVFCGAVCPLGAIQDAVVWRPVKVPSWLEQGLRFIAYIYLAAAVLLAINGVSFIICRFDPFVGFFRRTGSFPMLAFGGLLLVLGVFVARPYCRYLCPYGVLLSWLSPLSWKHATITPDECINCRLCETSCPFGAIQKPTKPGRTAGLGRKRFAKLLLLIPVLILVGVVLGRGAGVGLAKLHDSPQLIQQLNVQERSETPGLEIEAFRKGSTSTEEVQRQARSITDRLRFGGGIAGAFLGLALGLQLAGSAARRQRSIYTINRSRCLSCSRCFASCPREQQRLKEEDFDEGPS